MSNVKISGLTAYTNPASSDVLPIVDLLNDQTKKITVADLLKNGFGPGTVALPSFSFIGDPDTGIYSPGANQFAVTTGGTQRLLIDASGNTTIQGDLTVNGTTTTVSSNTLSIKDKNIEIAVVSTPSDTTADGGGITLKGATDKTLTWVDSTDCWTFNQGLNLTAGTAGAPALVFNGDVNSGLFQPGADSLAIATAGAQRVTVDSSGKVGIGTLSANELLHVDGIAQCKTMHIVNPTFSSKIEVGLGTTQNNFAFIDLIGDTTYTDYGLRIIRNNTGANTDSVIDHRGTGTLKISTTEAAPIDFKTNAQDRMRITSAGLVGIGTSNPETKLQIVGSTSSVASSGGTLGIRQKGDGSGDGITLTSSHSNSARIYKDSAGSLHIYNTGGSVDDFVLTTGGNLGIGTSTPSAELHVSGSGQQDIFIGSTNAGGARLVLDGDSNGDGSGGDFSEIVHSTGGHLEIRARNPGDSATMRFEVDTGEKMRIDSSGRVGIGASNPQELLQVGAGFASVNGALLISADTGLHQYIRFTNGGGTESHYPSGIWYQPAGRMELRAASSASASNAAQLVLANNGNVGIGTTSPNAKLHVNGNLNVVNSGATLAEFSNPGVATVYLGISGQSTNYYDANTQIFRAGNSSSERMRIDSSGRLLVGRTASVPDNIGANAYANIVQIQGNAAGAGLAVSNIGTGRINISRTYSPSNGDDLGYLSFGAEVASTVERARITCSAEFTDANKRGGRLAFATCANGSQDPVERLRIDSSGNVFIGGTSAGTADIALNTNGTATFADRITMGSSTNRGQFKGICPASFTASAAGFIDGQYNGTSVAVVKYDGTATFAGTVSDSLGPLRRVKVDNASTGFNLTAAYAGQLIRQTGSGQTIHFPNGVFSAGDMVSFFNVGTGTLTITAAGTMYNTADAATGNRTIAAKGMATVICTNSNEFAISGSQLT